MFIMVLCDDNNEQSSTQTATLSAISRAGQVFYLLNYFKQKITFFATF